MRHKLPEQQTTLPYFVVSVSTASLCIAVVVVIHHHCFALGRSLRLWRPLQQLPLLATVRCPSLPHHLRAYLPACSPAMPGFTPDEHLDLLFDPKLIPAAARDAIGSSVHVGVEDRGAIRGRESAAMLNHCLSLVSDTGPTSGSKRLRARTSARPSGAHLYAGPREGSIPLHVPHYEGRAAEGLFHAGLC